ncbi:MAG: cytochrome c biogenesis CcdA family protein [Aggregatilineales bacterium]
MLNVTPALAFLAGLLSFVSPCVLPLVPGYVGYMTNRVTARVDSQRIGMETRAAFPIEVVQQNRFFMALHGLSFVLGFTFVFVVFGLAIDAGTQLVASAFYDVQRDVIPRVGGVLIILFGLHFLGLLVPALHWLEQRPLLERLGTVGQSIKRGLAWLQSALYADTRYHVNRQSSYGLFGSALMGVIFAAGWTPCIGPVYGTILTLAASGSENLAHIGGLMTSYSLGLGLPFILAAVALDRTQGLLGRIKRHLRVLKVAGGLVMIGMGILVYTGEMQTIARFGVSSGAVFMYKVEDCTINVFEGKLAVGDIGSCIAEHPG